MYEFFSEEEMRWISGYTRPGWQIKWLREQGIPFFRRKDGHPLVDRNALKPSSKERSAPRDEPHLDDLASGGRAPCTRHVG